MAELAASGADAAAMREGELPIDVFDALDLRRSVDPDGAIDGPATPCALQPPTPPTPPTAEQAPAEASVSRLSAASEASPPVHLFPHALSPGGAPPSRAYAALAEMLGDGDGTADAESGSGDGDAWASGSEAEHAPAESADGELPVADGHVCVGLDDLMHVSPSAYEKLAASCSQRSMRPGYYDEVDEEED